jgi:hypothetical protein
MNEWKKIKSLLITLLLVVAASIYGVLLARGVERYHGYHSGNCSCHPHCSESRVLNETARPG